MNAALRAPPRDRLWPDGADDVAELPSPAGRNFHFGIREQSMRSVGLSAPGKVVQQHFGFDVADVLAAARRQVARHGAGLPE